MTCEELGHIPIYSDDRGAVGEGKVLAEFGVVKPMDLLGLQR